jgi:hypothetical protein
MFTIIGLVVSHIVVAVLAVLWGQRHPTTVASVEAKASAVQAVAKQV